MEIYSEKANNVSILSLSGKLNALTYTSFEEKVMTMIDAGDHSIIVDLKNVDYISSAGLRVFLRVVKKLNDLQGKIVLCSLQDQVKEVFHIAGFSSFFQMTATREEAIASFQA